MPTELENTDILLFMNEATSMGRFIRESRLQQGMSLGQLAASIGRSPSSVRRWERDEVAPVCSRQLHKGEPGTWVAPSHTDGKDK